jgi:serine/threonine protein kinase/formylglycine-generating enzyme required for sulfatase activity
MGKQSPPAAPLDISAFLRPAESPDELGRLGQYRVLQLLGQGGMGLVFRAEDLQLQRPVALKVMRPAVARHPIARERFLREARATAKVVHENVVTIFQVGEDRGVPFIVMQLLEGLTLEALLRRQGQGGPALSLPQVLKLGREIARGLGAAHGKGLIHRDVKPANVWLDSSAGGRVKILDFGLVLAAPDAASNAAANRLTQLGTFLGTPAYVAPEQGWGDDKLDGRADLFSLGCILYRLCAGRVPWAGSTAMDTLVAVALEEPTPLSACKPDLPPRFAGLVMQLISRKPDDRPKSADVVVQEIHAIERELEARPAPPPHLPAPPPPPPSAPPAPRPRSAGVRQPPAAAPPVRPSRIRQAPAEPRPILRRPSRGKPERRWAVAFAVICALMAAVGVAACVWLFTVAGEKPAQAERQEKPNPPAGAANEGGPGPAPQDPPRPAPDRVVVNSVGMRLVLIPAGKFLMGTSDADAARINREPLKGYTYPEWEKTELPQHEVRITRAFYLGAYEVTQGQYEQVMGVNPSANKESPEHPVERVVWPEAMEFCRRLSGRPEEAAAGRTYRLPTDAEWEYCCRAGTTTLFHQGDTLSARQANIDGKNPFAAEKLASRGKTAKVGSYAPNAWGLYDMHGNVWEWCADGDRRYGREAVNDPRGPEAPLDDKKGGRVLRGGSWREGACRSAFRKARPPLVYRGPNVGFRVACFVGKGG